MLAASASSFDEAAAQSLIVRANEGMQNHDPFHAQFFDLFDRYREPALFPEEALYDRYRWD